jgi:2-aminoadipate transaminase
MQAAPLALSSKALRTTDSPISTLIRLALETPGLISLAAGLVDETSLPSQEIARAAAEVLGSADTARAALQYGTTEGHLPLREKVLAHVCAADGVAAAELHLSPEEVVITTGSQQLLYLLGEVLLDPGDIVLTEAPSYFVYHGVLASKGVRVLSVPMDAEGMDTDALEALLRRLDRSGEIGRVKMIYTVDYFQNPTGLTLSMPRRRRLVELARRYSRGHRIVVLEDAAYRELRFDGPDLPSVKSFDETNEYVVSTYTFSKACSPGLKTGYGLLPRDLVGPVLWLKGGHDFGSNNFAQHVIDRLLETGAYHRHQATLAGVYRAKRDALVAALEQEFADWPEVTWTRPAGGLYVWLAFPPEVDTGPDSPLMKAALAHGVLFVPGEFGHVNEEGPVPTCEMRLCYGVAAPQELAEGVHRLRRAADEVAGRSPWARSTGVPPVEEEHRRDACATGGG